MSNLFENQTTDTSGSQDTVVLKNLATQQYATVWVSGTFDGATVGLEIKPQNSSAWITESDMEFTEAGVNALLVPHKMEVRGTISSAGSSTSIVMGVY